jgi:mRNA-degrading endonuclease HigB of HigAB toxin-antitoxin module
MNENNITKPKIQRLAFIKYLFNVAVEQSRRPEPLAAASILTFHDSIELFLHLACEYKDISIKKDTPFLGYWEILKHKLSGEGLTQKTAMSRLNTSRVGLKHQGLFPTKQDIEEFRASAMNFFIDNTSLVFDIDFENISMINLVTYEATKARLEKAEAHRGKEELKQALVEIAFAFAQLINDYETSKQSQFGHSPFFFGEDMIFDSAFSVGIRNLDDNRFSNFIDKVKDSIQAMQNAMKILSLGLDYRRYTKFRLLTPQIFQWNGKYSYRIIREEKSSIEDYEFCFNFVIDSAIYLQEFDFEPFRPLTSE